MQQKSLTDTLLDVLRHPQSYRNIVYLLLAFPTGLAYFLMLVIGFSLGVGLLVIGVGFFILLALFALTGVAANVERWLSNMLLGTRLPAQYRNFFSLESVKSRDHWRGIGFLALKFPLGILTFVVTVFTISFIGGMITMPFFYTDMNIPFVLGREIDTLWEAILSSVFGLMLLPFGMIFLNKMANAWRGLTRNLLSEGESVQYAKQKRISREDIEQDVINRLIDEGIVDEESLLLSQKRKRQAY